MASDLENLLKSYLRLENESGTSNKPPQLLSFERNFDYWNWRFKNFIRTNDYMMIRSIENGPHRAVTMTDGV